ncbi:hypothetical protein [Bacillus thuringiensis]|uniref:Uncharacterized protein n=1 Tax=Bacillus thuringiensis subsp. jegathesan TaxID=56955 RepID=A0A9X6R123_BACTJ|nr:hypothetical protein [Bacillus thuringiensis]OUB70754.1 hypothetical protein BK750_10430 [Bacillus thuringiensis serovar jegathesan]
MNYMKKLDEAIELFKNLISATTNEAKSAVLATNQDNEIADKLLVLLKNKTLYLPALTLLPSITKNDSNKRLRNYVSFVNAIDKLEGKKLNAYVFDYVLRHIDEEELKMYKAILTNADLVPVDETVLEEKIQEEVAQGEKVQEDVESA